MRLKIGWSLEVQGQTNKISRKSLSFKNGRLPFNLRGDKGKEISIPLQVIDY
jgi:hypothetical protein